MRSLCLLSEARAVLYPEDVLDSTGRSHIAVDPETLDVYSSVGTERQSWVYKVSVSQEVTEIATFPNQPLGTTAAVEVVGFQYVPELQALCVALNGGDLVLIPSEDGEDRPPEVVGTVDSGILCMEWSPDHELVVIVTGAGTILEMTKDFEVITEIPIHVEGTGKEEHVSVGWGKKETQFHGSEGKQAALRKDDALTGSNLISDDDDFRPRISWRGDGAYFACSAVAPNGNKRVIRMYDRECTLQYTSESVSQLEHALNWRPSGNLIAASQRLPHRHDIIFFEKNGLRHGEFALRDDTATVVEVAWNADSTVLGVWLQSGSPSAKPESVIQLWTANNYYWYLKQELRPVSENDSFSGMQWDPEVALRLHLTTRSGSYQRSDFCADQFVSTSRVAENPATVAVIDGCSVLLTPFKHLNVPPPMSAVKVQLPAPAAYVTFGPGNAGDDLAVLLCDKTVHLFKGGSVVKPVKVPERLGYISLPQENSAITFRQIAWIDAKTLLALAYDDRVGEDYVVIFTLDEATMQVCERRDARATNGVRSFVRLHCNVDSGIAVVEAADGRVAYVDCAAEQPFLHFVPGVPTMCPWISTAELRGSDGQSQQRILIGLSDRNKLYANDRLLSPDCTSFFVHDDFLILTTFTHTARFISLNVAFDDFTLPETTSSPFDEHVRRVERGSRIVTAVPGDISLVLQMPRGNLETVYPRALVLATVRRLIDKKDYRAAFLHCRKHRIDLNLLVDHNRAQFEGNIQLFVRQIDDPEYLNLFISTLRDEDVTVTMYYGAISKVGTTDKVEGKVNSICETIRRALEEVDSQRYTQSILTTDVKKTPPDLEAAMRRILLVKTKESPEAADAALKYVIFLADVDKLYDVALGMYDFPLVLMVAQHSQKDPREYLPFLSELQKLETNYQRYRIDDHLGKRETALRHLSLAGDEYYNNCLAYIKQHGLYKVAMDVFSDQKARYQEVLRLYADHLEERSDYEEAGLLYEIAGAKVTAMQAYQKALMWQQTFAIATNLGLPEAEITGMACDMSEEMIRRLQYRDAARILLDYAKKPLEAVNVLVKGSLWSEASRTACMYGHAELIDTAIKPKALEACAQMLEDIKDMSTEFDTRRERLHRWREEKARNLAAAEAGTHDPSLDNIDMFSDTTSMATTRITGASALTSLASRSTVRTARTAKARRKAERKRATGRDKAFEDEYLMNCLRKLINRSNDMRVDVLAMVRILMVHNHVERARSVQAAFKALVAKIQLGIPEIFIAPTQAPETAEDFKRRVMEGLPPPAPRNVEPPPKLSDAQYGISILE
ncbi:Elongator subunit IKI3 [Spizellomyces punctatus DAOM BR117]|uniref:Elongator complex protein 1 n=1 Tax=Spizellomyces punctatus (strain DAOM BR117) TaxID=645134 RepID=A0A0L0HNE9_SPIPD|nr:Elongator subunit IKI3 [Spizellomyces punctatus DAOM BR117]KND02563.1 hypothetical protein SPPG_03020 [Spizellomyces punctatus DAOM BR117]|eukprot:XP_016610602.1 hypothetical protein SPPG_03020 [Spizellomyces punctatus DAOM BR117]